jgi:Right handed beta helix region
MRFFILILATVIGSFGASISVINTGTTANDGTGDSVRVAFGKVNTNFTIVTNLTAELGFSITRYGAVSGADSYAAITNAIGSVGDGGVVYVPDGDFWTAKSITVDKTVRFQGTGTIRETAILSNIFYVTAAASFQGITVAGMETPADHTSAGATNRAGFRITADNVSIRDVTVTDKSLGIATGPGVSGLSVTGSRIRGCHTNNPTGINNSAGIELNSASNFVISGNYITKMGQGILMNDRSKFGTIMGNQIYTNYDNGIYGSSCENVQAIGNVCKGMVYNCGVKMRGYLNKVIGGSTEDCLQSVVLSPYAAMPDAGSDEQAYSAYFGVPTGITFNGYGNIIDGVTARNTARHVFQIDAAGPILGTNILAHDSAILNCKSFNGPTEAGYSVVNPYGNNITIRGLQAYGVNSADSVIVAAGLGTYQADGLIVEGCQILDTNNITLNGIYAANYRNVRIAGNYSTMNAASVRNIRLSGITNAVVTGNIVNGAIRVDSTASTKLTIQGNIAGSITLSTIPTSSGVLMNIASSITQDPAVYYFGNLGVDPIAYHGFTFDATNNTMGFLTPASTSTNVPWTFRKDIANDVSFWIRNSQADSAASMSLLVNSATSGGTLSAYHSGASPSRYSDSFVLKPNGDASGGLVIDAPGGQDIHFYSGGTSLKFKVDPNGPNFPTVTTNQLLWLDVNYRLQPVTNGGGWSFSNGTLSVP